VILLGRQVFERLLRLVYPAPDCGHKLDHGEHDEGDNQGQWHEGILREFLNWLPPAGLRTRSLNSFSSMGANMAEDPELYV
jgi:hypothetical protein